MKRLLLLLLLTKGAVVIAQNANDPGNLPSIIPPSPEVASLAKMGSLSSGLHTGSANVNVPLYELAVGSLKVPIALSYATNGTRTNDIASRVGLGWNLVAGGSISRVIHDEDDDGPNTIRLTPPSFSVASEAMYNYIRDADIEGRDTERDEYSFSVNGISGKFFFDNIGVIQVVEHSNIKVTRQNNSFTLTTGDGVIYKFGNNLYYEKTADIKTNGNQRAYKIKTTAWFLTSIISPEGHSINFHYNPIHTKAQLGPYQTVMLKKYQTTGDPGNIPCTTGCTGLCEGRWSPVGFNRIDYDTYYLSHVTTNNGQQVYFIYGDRPDASGDNRLIGVQVYTTNDASQARLIKKYQLEYQDYTVGNDLNQRFFLKKIYTLSTNSQEIVAHQFDYNDPSTLGSQESVLQDYYGFSKGYALGGQDNFFPRPLDYQNYENGYLGADRSPNFEATKAGTLSKVTYPTGGYEEFVYEQHTIAHSTTTSDTVFTSNVSRQGAGVNYSTAYTYTVQFTPTAAQTRMQYTTHWNPNGPAIGSPQYWTPDDIHFISYLEIWDVSSNTRVFEDRHKNYQTTNTYPQLNPGTTYEIRLRVVGNSHFSYFNLQYNPVIQTVTTSQNLNACGVRVKKINSYDPVSNKTTTKFYHYASLNNLNISTGVGDLFPSFQSSFAGGGICYWDGCNMAPGEIIFQCPESWYLKQISSSSVNSSYTFSGSPVAYQYVIESEDELMTNGAIEHKFYTYYRVQQVYPIKGSVLPGVGTTSMTPDMNGTELQTKIYKRQGNGFILLKETTNTYGYDTRINSELANYVVRKRFNTITEQVPSPKWNWEDKIKPFDLNTYLYSTGWMHLNNTTITEYDENGQNPFTQTISYIYDNTEHLQPTQVTTTNSRNETVTQQMQYPADFAVSNYPAMVSKNIITPVIETITLNSGIVISKIRTEYGGWQSGAFFKPVQVQIAKGNTNLENRLNYYSYDAAGNPRELSKENDMHISYIWNYQKTYPVAEVKNAGTGEVAYTSFEGDDWGGWILSDGSFIDVQGITGRKSYYGSLSFTPAISGTYTITLWSQNTDATVNNTIGQQLAQHNGWKLYTWTINGSSFTVSGSYLDEVRLYPVNAQMVTYTYDPFIGLTSACDANNQILYYFYDGFNRLQLIRDIDFNIVKQYEYKYNHAIASGCTTTSVNWQITGRKTCAMASNGNYTGEQLREERDMNNCSPTYLQTRWVSLGVTGQCTPIPNCDTPDKRVINGVCEVGTKVLISSSFQNGQYHCMFKYIWSDAHESHAFIEVQSSSCMAVMPL